MSEVTEAQVAAAVRNAIGAYAQAQDAGKSDDVVALFTPDGVLELPGVGPIEGPKALLAAFDEWAPKQPQLHLTGNTVITSWTEDEATATSDLAFIQRGESGWAVQVVGHYTDALRYHEGKWRFYRRTLAYQM